MEKEKVIYRKEFELREGDSIEQVYGKVIIQRAETGRYQVYNQYGKLFIPGEHKDIKVFEDGAIICENEITFCQIANEKCNKEKSFSLYSADGELKVCDFQNFETYCEEWMSTSEKKNRIGLKSKWIKINKDKLTGTFSSSGEKILDIEFDNIWFGWGFFFVRKHKFTGVYSQEGKEIIPVEYEDLQFHQGSFYTTKDGTSGVFSKRGKKIHD